MIKNSVETIIQDNKVIYKRHFEVPIHLAFEVWSSHEHLAQWWGPDGFTLTTQRMDFSNNGIWDFIMHGPDGQDYKNRIQFTDIQRPHRICYKHLGDGKDEQDVAFQVKVTFEAAEEGTNLTFEQIFPSKEELERVDKKYGAIEGAKQHIGNFGKYLDVLKSGKPTMQKITPFLWFDHQAEEAMNFYVSIFKNSKVLSINRYGKNAPMPEGTVLTASFELNGLRFVTLNGGQICPFSPATSFVVDCENQDEVDYYWEKLGAGGKHNQCAWLDDKFGVTWQIVPKQLGELLSDPDPDKAGRVMRAMMQMNKIIIADLQRAYDAPAT